MPWLLSLRLYRSGLSEIEKRGNPRKGKNEIKRGWEQERPKATRKGKGEERKEGVPFWTRSCAGLFFNPFFFSSSFPPRPRYPSSSARTFWHIAQVSPAFLVSARNPHTAHTICHLLSCIHRLMTTTLPSPIHSNA